MNSLPEEIRQLKHLGHIHAAKDLEDYQKQLKKLKPEVKNAMAAPIPTTDQRLIALEEKINHVTESLDAINTKLASGDIDLDEDLNQDGTVSTTERIVAGIFKGLLKANANNTTQVNNNARTSNIIMAIFCIVSFLFSVFV